MLLSRELLDGFFSEARAQGKRIVFTNGCFDIIHPGHVKYLEQSKKLGDILVVGLNSDDSVKRLKGPSRPVNNEEDRSIVLSALRCIDYVTIFNEDTPYEIISIIKPDVLVKGGDYSFETIVGADIVTALGGDVVVIPLVEGKSTTSIIKKMHK
jgi:D-beta-D-heptose 7-phosphate kinase/D-beta-D-heptose 1-phosphate adenosyltransferase